MGPLIYAVGMEVAGGGLLLWALRIHYKDLMAELVSAPECERIHTEDESNDGPERP